MSDSNLNKPSFFFGVIIGSLITLFVSTFSNSIESVEYLDSQGNNMTLNEGNCVSLKTIKKRHKPCKECKCTVRSCTLNIE